MGTLYENIISLCESKRVKPGKMCNDIELSRGLITDLKMGRKSSITVDTAQKIADYFGVSVDRVLGNEQKETPTPKSERNYEDERILDAIEKADPATREAILLLLKLR